MGDEGKIAIFDFCETLVDFQTADEFVNFVRGKLNSKSINRRETVNRIFRSIPRFYYVDILTGKKFSICKRLKLWQLKGVKEETLDSLAKDYYNERIKPHFIKTVIESLQQYQKDGCEVWIVSGGYKNYIKYFAKDYGINKLIASEIACKKGFCQGKLKGDDCMGAQKVKQIKQLINEGMEINVVFSDSISDLPLLLLGKEGYVVTRSHQSWSEEYQLKELIW